MGSPKFNRFDFWFCFAVENAALFGMLVGSHFSSGSSLLAYLAASASYAGITAATVAWLAPRIGVPSFPMSEGLWRGKPSTTATIHVIGAAGIGIATAGVSVCYAIAVTGIHRATGIHGATLPRHHIWPSVIDLCCAPILEEILHRAIIFAFLVGVIRWSTGVRSRSSETAAVWTANLLQALIFGAAHVFTGMSLLYGRPWYIRLLLSTQTWDGLILGWIYWRYGLESAIACHVASDLSLLVISKGVVSLR